MNKPPEVHYNPGCLWAFAVLFFFVPALMLFAFAGFSLAGGCVLRVAGSCIPSPDYATAYLVLGGIFTLAGLGMSLWAVQQGKKK